MHPVVFRLPEWLPLVGGSPIRFFGLFIVDAFFFATMWAQWRWLALRHEDFRRAAAGLNPMRLAVAGSIVSRILWLAIPGPDWKLRLLGVFLVDVALMVFARRGLGRLMDTDAKRKDADFLFSLAFWLLIAGFVGSRLFWIVTTPSGRADFVDQPLHALFAVWDGGIVYYGGLLGAAAFGLWYVWVKNESIPEIGDILMIGVAFTLYIGRWACFSAGCDHGVPTDAAWGTIFQPDPGGIDRISLIPPALQQPGTPIHPTQLYMSLNGLVIFLVLGLVYAVRQFPGQVIYLFLMLYPAGRYLVEIYRGDEGRGLYPVGEGVKLSSSQIISLPVCFLAMILYLRAWAKARRRAAG